MEFSYKTLNILFDAVVTFCWYKRHLRQLFSNCDIPNSLLNKVDWTCNKREITEFIFEEIKSHPVDAVRIGCFGRLINQLVNLNDQDIERNFAGVDDSKKRLFAVLTYLSLI